MLRYFFRITGVLSLLHLVAILTFLVTAADAGMGVISYRDIISVDAERGIYVYDIDRNLHHFLMPFSGPYLSYTWSGTGHSILFVQQEDAQAYRLYEYEIATATRRDLPRIWTHPVTLRMAPDNENLAVVGARLVELVQWQEPDLPSQILVDDTAAIQIANVSVDWSPDGENLLITATPDGNSGFRIAELNTTTGTLTELNLNAIVGDPRPHYISQDQILYQKVIGETMTIMSYNLRTGASQTFMPDAGNVQYLEISRDDNFAIFLDTGHPHGRTPRLLNLDTDEMFTLSDRIIYAIQWMPR